MPNPKDYDWNYRPDSYWEGPENDLNNIKGEMRRRLIEDAMSEREYDDIPDEILKDELSDNVRRFIGALHPANMGGEYLPPYLPDEVEIARVSMESVTGDVISIRARKTDDGLIHYRMVDEYEDSGDGIYKCHPETSSQPLTFGELVSVIDNAERTELEDESLPGLANHLRDSNYLCDRSEDRLDTLVEFVDASSPFYPELGEWYEAEAQEWYETRLAELRAEKGIDEEPELSKVKHIQCPRCMGRGSIEDPETGKVVDCEDCGGIHGDGLVPIRTEAPECGPDCEPVPAQTPYWLADYTREDLRLTYTADRELMCVFSTLIVKTEALKEKFDGGLSAFLEKYHANCNRELAVLCEMATCYLDDAVIDIDDNGLVYGKDYIQFEPSKFAMFFDQGREVDLECEWLKGFVKDIGMMVHYAD